MDIEEDRCKRVMAPKSLPVKEFSSNNKGYTKTNVTSHAPQTRTGIMKFYGPAEGIHPPSKQGYFAKQVQFQSRRYAEQQSNSRIWNGSRSFNPPRDKQTIKVDHKASNEPTSASAAPLGVSGPGDKYNGAEFRTDCERAKEPTSVPMPLGVAGPGDKYSGAEFRTDFERAKEPTTVPMPLGVAGPGGKYSGAEFRTDYERAKFYVIKSFSEDDVHKCIKYEVWSSTAYGNNKLEAAYHDAQLQTCPVFLFFSVNGSGQFVGLAEMIGKVDFNKSLDFWQLDMWRGFFPVKWHIMKDIPNPQLKHIRLQNNENKPVTFTRDTQEIELKEGLQMLRIFKNYAAKSSILERTESQ